MVFEKPTPFVPRYLRREVTERISYKGEILTPLSEEDIRTAVEYLKKEQVEAIAVCYINSYANEEHERKTSKNYGRKYMYARLLISRENGVNMKEPQQLF